jgi:hypothetical protein
MKPIRYRVLLVGQMSAKDKAEVTAKAAAMNSGPEAELASFRQTLPGLFVNENWQYEELDQRGRAAVLKYKGIEVALYFKRQVGEVEPLPTDPVPEGVLKDPIDAWVRLDLTGQSARQTAGRVGKQKKSVEEALTLAQQELLVKQALIDRLETDVFQLSKEVEKLMLDVARLKSQAKNQDVIGKKPSAPEGLKMPRPVRVPAPPARVRRRR